MTMRLISVYCSIITLIGYFTACGTATREKSAIPPPPNTAPIQPEGYIVRSSQISDYIKISGSLMPFETTNLNSEVSGRVVSVYLPEGKAVSKGTLLVKIFDGDLQAQLRKVEAQLKIAENVERRQAQLLKVEGISQQEYEASLLQVNSLKADIELIKVNIARTELRAPFDGVIGLKNISVGAYINPNVTVATLRQLNQLKLDFNIPEKYSSIIREGDMVTFTVDGSEQKYQARVLASEQDINPSTRNLRVRAVVQGNQSMLVSGAFAEVELSTRNAAQTLLVPSQAIIPQARSKQIIVSKDGKAKFVNIKTGVRQAKMVEILDGVALGDTIATTGVLFIRPDTPLKFSKIQ